MDATGMCGACGCRLTGAAAGRDWLTALWYTGTPPAAWVGRALHTVPTLAAATPAQGRPARLALGGFLVAGGPRPAAHAAPQPAAPLGGAASKCGFLTSTPLLALLPPKTHLSPTPGPGPCRSAAGQPRTPCPPPLAGDSTPSRASSAWLGQGRLCRSFWDCPALSLLLLLQLLLLHTKPFKPAKSVRLLGAGISEDHVMECLLGSSAPAPRALPPAPRALPEIVLRFWSFTLPWGPPCRRCTVCCMRKTRCAAAHVQGRSDAAAQCPHIDALTSMMRINAVLSLHTPGRRRPMLSSCFQVGEEGGRYCGVEARHPRRKQGVRSAHAVVALGRCVPAPPGAKPACSAAQGQRQTTTPCRLVRKAGSALQLDGCTQCAPYQQTRPEQYVSSHLHSSNCHGSRRHRPRHSRRQRCHSCDRASTVSAVSVAVWGMLQTLVNSDQSANTHETHNLPFPTLTCGAS